MLPDFEKKPPQEFEWHIDKDIVLRDSYYFRQHFNTDEAYMYEKDIPMRGLRPFILVVDNKGQWEVYELAKWDAIHCNTRKQALFLGLSMVRAVDLSSYLNNLIIH